MARPAHKIREGRVELAIWENTRESGPPYDLMLSRSYKTDDGWKTSTSFSPYDLKSLIKALKGAKKFIAANAVPTTPDKEDGAGQ